MTDTTPRAHLQITDPTRAEFTESLARALRAGADSPAPGSLLVTASMLLDIASGGADPSTTTATLVRGLSAWNRPECSAGALAMATLVGDGGLRREVRRDAAERGHLLPRWLVELHRADPSSGRSSSARSSATSTSWSSG